MVRGQAIMAKLGGQDCQYRMKHETQPIPEEPEYLVSLTKAQINAIWDVARERSRVYWSPWSEIANRLALALRSRK